MHLKDIQKKENNFRKLIIYPVILGILMFFSWYYFLWSKGRWYYAKEQVYFLIFSTCVLFLAISIRKVLAFFLKGKNIEFMGKVIIIFGVGLTIFLFFYFISDNEEFKNASIGILFLTMAVIVYKLKEIYKSGVYSESILIASSYIIAGITIKIMHDALWTGDDTGNSINIILVLSFILLSVMQLTSLIDITGKTRLVKVSMWLKKNHLLKILAINAILFLLINVRRVIVTKSIMGGWIFIFVVLFVVFLIIIINIRREVKKEVDVKLKKHLQTITYDKIRDISSISVYVDDFISEGKKSGLTSYLFFMAYRVEIPVVTASKIIAPILEYKDIESSEIISKRTYKVIEERNKQNRIKVVEDITNNLEFYGRR